MHTALLSLLDRSNYCENVLSTHNAYCVVYAIKAGVEYGTQHACWLTQAL